MAEPVRSLLMFFLPSVPGRTFVRFLTQLSAPVYSMPSGSSPTTAHSVNTPCALPPAFAFSTRLVCRRGIDFRAPRERPLRRRAEGESRTLNLEPGRYASEAPFAPRVDAKDEDDGYLVSFITDENTGTSECILVDAKRFEDGPVCRIALPHKICSGTHAHWAERSQI